MMAFINMLMKLAAALLGDRWLGRRVEDAERRVQELAELKRQLTTPVPEQTATGTPHAPPSPTIPSRTEDKLTVPDPTGRSKQTTTNK